MGWHTSAMKSHGHEARTLPDLDELFLPGIASVLSLAPSADCPLTSAELAAARSFAPGRLAEFRHGRYCARSALLRLGADAGQILIGANREPLWPAGIIGSISHAGDTAAAVVAWQAQFAAIGLDLEPAAPLEDALVPRICRPEELAVIAATSTNPGEAARRIFSMKEAAYKALWPIIGCFLDFHNLEVRLAADIVTFAVCSHSDRCPKELAASLTGRFTQRGALFISAVCARR